MQALSQEATIWDTTSSQNLQMGATTTNNQTPPFVNKELQKLTSDNNCIYVHPYIIHINTQIHDIILTFCGCCIQHYHKSHNAKLET